MPSSYCNNLMNLPLTQLGYDYLCSIPYYQQGFKLCFSGPIRLSNQVLIIQSKGAHKIGLSSDTCIVPSALTAKPASVTLTCNNLVEHVTTPAKWYKLGLALGVDDSVLQVIEQDTKGDVETGLRRMFQQWLSSCEQPSWDNVIQALRRIRENRLAAEIYRKF